MSDLQEYLDVLEDIISDHPRSSALKSFYASILLALHNRRGSITTSEFIQTAREHARHLEPTLRFHIFATLGEAHAKAFHGIEISHTGR